MMRYRYIVNGSNSSDCDFSKYDDEPFLATRGTEVIGTRAVSMPRGVGMAPSIVTLRVFVAHYRWNLGCVEQQHFTSKLRTPATCLVEETVKCQSGATGLTVTGTVREQT
uniref:Uncharacterized protein n=1 Tax=Timema douglasi TaxID=61478 RepID=A0A7R8VU49_TIMDO|nr:unnamed protein product [Timema douglasi]